MRAHRLVLTAAVLALVVAAATGCDLTVRVDTLCGTAIPVTVPMHTALTPDSVRRGEHLAVLITPATVGADGAEVRSARFVYPLPDGVEPVGEPTAVGGTIAVDVHLDGRSIVASTGPFVQGAVTFPDVHLDTVISVSGPRTIGWPAFSELFVDLVFQGTPIGTVCSPRDASTIVNNIDVRA